MLPVLSKLKTNVSLAEESLTCKPLAKGLIEGIDKRFSDDFKNPDRVLAAVLSPMFKFDWIREEKDKNDALKHLERELRSIVSIEKTEEKFDDNLNKQSTDFEFFFSSKKNKSSSTDQIIDLYKSDFIKAVQDFDKNPPLKELYVKHNTLLPSSAAVECLFSIAGNIFRKNRVKLTDMHFKQQLLLKMNTC